METTTKCLRHGHYRVWEWREQRYPNPVYMDSSIWNVPKFTTKYCVVSNERKSMETLNDDEYKSQCSAISSLSGFCQYDDKIYIVDGVDNKIFSFDPDDNTLQKEVDIERVLIGKNPSCFTTDEYIHIFHGSNSNTHLLYNPTTKEMHEFWDNVTMSKTLSCVSVFGWKDQLIKFGGINHDTKEKEDTFMIGSIYNKNDNEYVEWKTKVKYKLPAPMYGYGHVLHNNLIIIFGGETNDDYSATIYVLDLEKDDGWMRVQKIQCPMRSTYDAVIDAEDRIHLFETSGDISLDSYHFTIPVSVIIEQHKKDQMVRNFRKRVYNSVNANELSISPQSKRRKYHNDISAVQTENERLKAELEAVKVERDRYKLCAASFVKIMENGTNPDKGRYQSCKSPWNTEWTLGVQQLYDELTDDEEDDDILDITQHDECSKLTVSIKKAITKYLEIEDNESEFCNPSVMIKDEVYPVRDVLKRRKIRKEYEIPALVGSYGIFAKQEIPRFTVLGEYG